MWKIIDSIVGHADKCGHELFVTKILGSFLGVPCSLTTVIPTIQ